MDISFSCDKCGQNIAIDEAGAGQLIDCPNCGTPIEVPHKSKSIVKDAAIPTSAAITARVAESVSPKAFSRLVRNLAGLAIVIVIVVGGFYAYNLWRNQQEAKAKAAAEKAQADAAAEVAKAKVEAAAEVERAKRDFTVDVFIRTKGGESIKCGLVTVLVFDEATIKDWQPGISKILTDHASSLLNDFVAANAKKASATSAWELAVQKKAAARKRLVVELQKARPDAYVADDGESSDLDQESQRKAAPAAYKHVEMCVAIRDQKEKEKEIAEKECSEKSLSLRIWPQTVSATILDSLPEPMLTAKTDADGRCAGKVSKPGRYAFCAQFSRQVGDATEQDTWLIWVRLDDPTSKKIMLSNDNTLLSGSPDNVLQNIPAL